jgi:hypothetical protein
VVAAPVAGRLKLPRAVTVPFTSKVEAGVVELIPIFAVLPVPLWNSTEFPRVPVLLVHNGRKSVVPVPLNAGVLLLAPAFVIALIEVPPAPGAVASIKADAGSPPTVSASAAFNAYGTLSNSTRGCSCPPLMVTPSQRA